MDLVEFIAARLDEEEAAAKGVPVIDKAPWHLLEWYDGEFEGGETARVDLRSRTGAITYGGALPRAVGVHIVRHDPARVLAEIGAKRNLINDLTWNVKISEGDDRAWFAADSALDYCLRYLAKPFAAHPDYDPAWTIDAAH